MAHRGSKSIQPHNADFGDRSKVHLRALNLGEREWSVVTLRPGVRACWSTNFFHETWHIVSDAQGSRALARLLWGLSLCKRPNTAVVLHGEHLRPTPFEAEPSDPIVLLNSHLAPADSKSLRQLKSSLPHLGPPQGFARWSSRGLDSALQALAAGEEPSVQLFGHDAWWRENRHLWQQEKMARLGGCVCYAAPPPVLQAQARMEARPSLPSGGMDFWYLAENSAGGRGRWHPDGEVQIFCDYQARLSHARTARREVLSEAEASGQEPALEDLRQQIYARAEQIKRRGRKPSRKTNAME